MRNQDKVVCRPCKERNDWEIQSPNGTVYSKHYKTKAECVKAGREYASEFSCDLEIEDLKNSRQSNKTASSTRGKRSTNNRDE